MPCAPCQAAKETCTFDTPSRRPAKKRSTIDGAVSNTLDTVGIPSGSRPRIRSQIKAPKLEKHLSTQQVVDMDALEAIIRNVPPSIHNTLINQLDASMSSSTSPSYLSSLATNNIGQSQNQTGNQPFSFGHGMTVPGGFAFSTGNANDFGGRANIANANADTGGFDLGNSPGGSGSGFSFGNNPYLGPQAILNGGGMGHDVQGKYANGAALTTKAQGKARETSVGDLERALGAMNLSNGYLYLDEIGQTKWQGKWTSDKVSLADNPEGLTRTLCILQAPHPDFRCWIFSREKRRRNMAQLMTNLHHPAKPAIGCATFTTTHH